MGVHLECLLYLGIDLARRFGVLHRDTGERWELHAR